MSLVRRLARVAATPMGWLISIMAEPALLVMWVLVTVAVVHIVADAVMWLLHG